MEIRQVQNAEFRNTKQKQIILDCIKNCGYSHFTVEDIYEHLKKCNKKISLATVYRNIHALEEQGIIKKIYIADDNTSFYELSSTKQHYHLVCSRCGAIIDFDESLMESFEKIIERKNGFIIKDHRVVFYGLCSSCREKQNTDSDRAL